MMRNTCIQLTSAIVLLLSNACDSAPASVDKSPTERDRAGSGASGRASTGAGGNGGNAGTPDEAGQVEIVPSNGEVCDGLDNDKNGLIDDADVERDGVCDCLRIASVGRPGTYGGGGDIQFRTWPNAMAQHHVDALDDAELTAERLAPYDVLIVLNVSTYVDVAGQQPYHAFKDSELKAFEEWVRAGGGAFTTSGYSADTAKEVVNVNKLLAPFKLAYSPTKVELNGIISDWTSHPITNGVQRVYTEVGSEPDGAEALTLAKDAKGHVALQVPMSGPEKVIVWGDEWITYASQWRVEADQQVERLWVNALTWLSRDSSCQH